MGYDGARGFVDIEYGYGNVSYAEYTFFPTMYEFGYGYPSFPC